MFAAFLAKHRLTMETLVEEHGKHFARVTATKESREVSEEELKDLRAMLTAESVAPVSDSVTSYAQQKAGQKTAGPWTFVASLRAQKSKTEKKDKAKGKTEKQKSARGKGSSSAAAEACAPPTEKPDAAEEQANLQESARQLMVDMGFSLADITMALEGMGFEFGKALLLLLNGLDQQRTNIDRCQKESLHRHSRQTVNWKIDPKLADDSVFSNYKERALESFGVAVDVWDLGMTAGDTSNAGHSELLWMYGT